MAWLMEQVCETAGIKPIAPNMPEGVELMRRVNGNASWLFVLNHSGEKVEVPVEGHGRELLTGQQVDGSIELEPMSVAVIQLS